MGLGQNPDMCAIMRPAGETDNFYVHKAMWHGTLVAAKILKDSAAITLGDFRAEVAVLYRVQHPNAVKVNACALSPV